MKTSVLSVLFAAALAATAAEAQTPEAAPAAASDILVVYFSSEDCRWCTHFESGFTGLETKWKASPEFSKVAYRTIKNRELANPYSPSDFPADLMWVWDSMEAKQKRPPRPSWHIYQGRKLIGTYAGYPDWNGKAYPKIKELVAAGAAPKAEVVAQ